MWKAIINWINSKAYRCEHDYELLSKIDVIDRDYPHPIETKYTYRCVKCCEHKTIKV